MLKKNACFVKNACYKIMFAFILTRKEKHFGNHYANLYKENNRLFFIDIYFLFF